MSKKFFLRFVGSKGVLGSILMSFLIAVMLALAAVPAQAQLSGHNLKGDFGLKSGSQAAPGFYLSAMYLNYRADELRNRDGESIILDPERRSSLSANGYMLVLSYVADFKLFGANVGFMVAPSLTNNSLEIPILGLELKTETGFSDLYIQPLVLGWHGGWADLTVGLGLFAPIGRYDVEGKNDTGLGMWSFELFAGTTIFFDKKKSWHLATTAFYETHTKKKDSDMKVGDILTLEGGLGKSLFNGALTLGVAYYAQWKLTEDDFGLGFELPGGPLLGKHKVFGFGPELTIPIATKKKLFALVNARYIWESGARTMVEGNTLLITAIFPIPSIRLDSPSTLE